LEPGNAAAGAAQAAKYVEEEEGATHRLIGPVATLITVLAVVMSLFHLYAAYGIVPANILRPVHVGFVLVLSFLSFPIIARLRDRIGWWDWVLAAISAVSIAYVIAGTMP
jgi:TRAP-type uncharacterized transport system fused permease subunit